MQDSLELSVKEALKEMVLFIKKPHGTSAYNTIEKIVHHLEGFKGTYEPICVETIGYALISQVDFITNVMLLHPSSVYQKWFFDKINDNLDHIETLTSATAVHKIDLFNETAAKLILNNIDFERFQLTLVIEQKVSLILRNHREGTSNAAFFYGTVDYIMSIISMQQFENQAIIESLVYALHFLDDPSFEETSQKLLPKVLGVINPAQSEEIRKKSLKEADSLVKDFAVKTSSAYWYAELEASFEQKETAKFIEHFSKVESLKMADTLLSDNFLLNNVFKRRYPNEELNHIVFSSAARVSSIVRNFIYILPENQHAEVLQLTIKFFAAFNDYLKSRYEVAHEIFFNEPGNWSELTKMEKATALMKEAFQNLIDTANGIIKRYR